MIISRNNVKSSFMFETIAFHVAGRVRRVAAMCAACLAAPVVMAAPQPPVHEIDIADYRAYLDDDHPARQGMHAFARAVESASNGGLRVRVRSDGLPGDPERQLAALRAGGAGAPALMLVAGTGLAAMAPAFTLLDLPFLVRDEAHADRLLDGPFGDALLARLAPPHVAGEGLVGLAWWENGLRHITSAGAPLRHAADLRGLALRVIDEPVFVEGARAMGAAPHPLPFDALYEALRARRVAAQDNFISQIVAGRLYEVQSALTLTGHSYGALVLVANPTAWRALDPDQRRIVRLAALEAAQVQRRLAREEAVRGRALLAQRGMVVHALAPAELERLRTLTGALRASYFSRHEPALWRLYQQQDGIR